MLPAASRYQQRHRKTGSTGGGILLQKLTQETFVVNGTLLPVRPNLGLYSQPMSFFGMPVVAVPVPLRPLPIGVQIIAAPWREDIALRVAHTLEAAGVVAAPQPMLETSP